MDSEVSRIVPQPDPLPILAAIVVSLRPYQWGKNIFLFAALLFSGEIQNPSSILRSLTAFGLFCAASSGVYLLNDLKDREKDRLHPKKCKRPLAAGMLPVSVAVAVMFLLLCGSLAGSYLLTPALCGLIAIYMVINLGYSMGLKEIPILDVMLIAIGFVIRAVAGAVAIQVIASAWMVLCTMTLALVLGFGKRRGEVLQLDADASQHRNTLGEYSIPLLDMFITISACSAIVTYSLYTLSPETIEKIDSKALVLTVPYVMFGVFRYLYLMQIKEAGSDPSRLVFTDPPMLINGTLWVLTSAGILFEVLYWPFW